eukprot:6777853-Prymnesium_polylepis.1
MVKSRALPGGSGGGGGGRDGGGGGEVDGVGDECGAWAWSVGMERGYVQAPRVGGVSWMRSASRHHGCPTSDTRRHGTVDGNRDGSGDGEGGSGGDGVLNVLGDDGGGSDVSVGVEGE